jgi:AcrR family transcriptional regulator
MFAHPGRAEQEAKWRQERILNCAEEVYLRLGREGFTMDAVAKEAGYSVASLYNYFKNKDVLERALRNRVLQRVVGDIEKLPEVVGTTEEALHRLLAHFFKGAESNRMLMRSLMGERMVSACAMREEFDDQSATIWEAVIEYFRKVLERGQQRGEVTAQVPSQTLALCFDGVIHSFAMRWTSSDDAEDLSAQVPIIVGLFLNGARAV